MKMPIIVFGALEAIVPAWSLPFAAPAAFERYEQFDQSSAPVSPAPRQTASRRNATPRNTGVVSSSPIDVPGALRTVWIAGSAIGLCILLVGVLRLTWLAARGSRLARNASRADTGATSPTKSRRPTDCAGPSSCCRAIIRRCCSRGVS